MASKWDPDESWVVYRRAIRGSAEGVNAVCTGAEWDELKSSPCCEYTLLRDGIQNEGEAERLARGRSGDRAVRGESRRVGPATVPAM